MCIRDRRGGNRAGTRGSLRQPSLVARQARPPGTYTVDGDGSSGKTVSDDVQPLDRDDDEDRHLFAGAQSTDSLCRRRGDGGAGPQTLEDVYVEAMSLDAEGRVSGQSSIEWRQELAGIIDSLRYQMLRREGAGVVGARLHLLTDDDVTEATVFNQVVTRQKSKR